MARRTLFAMCVPLFVQTAPACAPAASEQQGAGTSEIVVTRVDGGATGSSFAKAGATYLSSRLIDTLQQVGALDGTLGALAQRSDGIIATSPADGRLSVNELATMERPGIVETLFPEEKAALPRLWALLETTSDGPTAVPSPGALVEAAAVDVSVPPGTLAPPAFVAVDSLPAHLVGIARRVELTQDADGDASTIATADLDAAIASPAPYTPAEIAEMEAILALFSERSTSSYRARAELSPPFRRTTPLPTFGSLSLSIEDSLAYFERRDLHQSSPSYPEGPLTVTLEGVTQRRVAVSALAGAALVAIDEATGSEQIVDASRFGVFAGTKTFEVWQSGVRQSHHRAAFAADVEARTVKKDLSHYADYELSAGGAPLHKNVVSASARSTFDSGHAWEATYVHETSPAAVPSAADGRALAKLVTPQTIPSGRYEVPVASGTVTIDVAPSGVVWFRRASGATLRASVHVWHETKFHAMFPGDRFRMVLTPSTKELILYYDGSSGPDTFRGPLLLTMRKG